MRCLVRKEIEPHPWRLHKWQWVDGTVGLFGIVRQCAKCQEDALMGGYIDDDEDDEL